MMVRAFHTTVCVIHLIFKAALPLALTLILVAEMHEYSRLITPLAKQVEAPLQQRVAAAPEDRDVEESLRALGAPAKKIMPLAEAVRYAARATNLPRELLVALMYTESSFREDAVSSKQYKGLMQVPHEIPYADANVLVGARILEDKVRLAGGDIKIALAMYKGGADNQTAQRYADHTLGVYERLRKKKLGRK